MQNFPYSSFCTLAECFIHRASDGGGVSHPKGVASVLSVGHPSLLFATAQIVSCFAEVKSAADFAPLKLKFRKEMHMNKTRKITFRVSDYEHKLIQSKLKKAGIGLSEFCRYAVLGKEVRHIEGLDKCGYELNKIGNNINQIALLCHQRAVQNPNLDEIRKQLCAVTERIYDVLGGGEDIGDSQAD